MAGVAGSSTRLGDLAQADLVVLRGRGVHDHPVGQLRHRGELRRAGRERARIPEEDGEVGDQERAGEALQVRRRGTFGVDRDLLGANLRAATPGVAEGRETHVHVRLAFGIGDEHHGPRRVTACQLRDGGRDLLSRFLVRHHDHVEHAGAEGEGAVVVGAQLAELVLYLPDAHPPAAGGPAGLPDHGLLHSLPSRERRSSASGAPRSLPDRRTRFLLRPVIASRGRVSSRRPRPRLPG